MVFARAWQPVVAARYSTTAEQKDARDSARSAGLEVIACVRAPRAQFSSDRRLASSKDFGRVFAGAKRSSDEFFTVLARANSANMARLGLTVSRRAARRATDRNKLKRLARESFRQRQLPAWDFVVIAKPNAASSDKGILRDSLDRHFERLTKRAAAEHDG